MPSPLPLRARSQRRSFPLFVLTSALALLALAGCSKDEAQNAGTSGRTPAAARLIAPNPLENPNPFGDPIPWSDLKRNGANQWYPLAVGNHWEYRIRTRTTTILPAGIQPPVDNEYPFFIDIVGTTMIGGRRYYQQAEYDPRVLAPPQQLPYYERQDRTGLYELDFHPYPLRAGRASGALSPLAASLVASVEKSPAAAAHPAAFRAAALELAARVERMIHPGPIAEEAGRLRAQPVNELALLRYPLHVGSGWIVRELPRFSRRVTARERLTLPAGEYSAWRITGDSEVYGPNDRVNFWYGNAGLLRIQVHAEGYATDNSGNIIGTLLFDSDQVLTAVKLRGPLPAPGFSAGETSAE